MSIQIHDNGRVPPFCTDFRDGRQEGGSAVMYILRVTLSDFHKTYGFHDS